MSRTPRRAKAQQAEAVEVTQEAPTAARERNAQGFEIDAWGLPFNGPARIAALAELGQPDPNKDPDAWTGFDPGAGELGEGGTPVATSADPIITGPQDAGDKGES